MALGTQPALTWSGPTHHTGDPDVLVHPAPEGAQAADGESLVRPLLELVSLQRS